MPEPFHEIASKRAYEPPAPGDGVRILVDRLWPRGLRKREAHFNQWRKDLAPSTEFRQFYGHRPERFAEFRKRYHTELRRKDARAAVSELIDTNRRRPITLLTASRDLEHSEAAVLAEHLQRIMRGAPDDPITAARMKMPHVVIVGAEFGGIAAAKALRRRDRPWRSPSSMDRVAVLDERQPERSLVGGHCEQFHGQVRADDDSSGLALPWCTSTVRSD